MQFQLLIDINECDDGLHNCERVCMIIHGQFECLCLKDTCCILIILQVLVC